MYKYIIFCASLIAACRPPVSHAPGMRSSIDSIMHQQQSAWNRGDLRGFMEGYWENDSLCFIGKRGLTRGWNATLENYVKGYPDPVSMGTLRFTPLKFDSIAPTAAFVVGKWELYRQADTLSGHYSLLWKQISGKWVIVADHSS